MDAFTVAGVLKQGLTHLVGLLAGAALLFIPSSAYASDAESPEDVIAAFSNDSLESLRAMNAEELADKDSGAPDFSHIVSFGLPHRVHQWSESLLVKADTTDPVASLDEWVAPIIDDTGAAVGVYRVWRSDPGSRAEYAGYDSDAEFAAALSKVPASVLLVDDPSIGGWYALDGTQLSPLNKLAQVELPYAESLDSIAPIISERHNEMIRQSADHEDSAGGSAVGLMTGVAVLVLAGAAGPVYFVRKARNTA